MKLSHNTKTTLWVIAIIVLTLAIWFGAEKAVLYWKMNAPFPKQWAALQLSNGEILYGHFAGKTGGTIGLKDVFTLEQVSPVLPSGEVTAGAGYLVSGVIGPELGKRVVPLEKTSLLFIPRSSVVYWKFVDSADPAYPYLSK